MTLDNCIINFFINCCQEHNLSNNMTPPTILLLSTSFSRKHFFFVKFFQQTLMTCYGSSSFFDFGKEFLFQKLVQLSKYPEHKI